MSLVCNECEIDMQPGNKLPGREGVMVHPVLLSLAYVAQRDSNNTQKYKLIYMKSEQNRAICFQCIEKNLFDSVIIQKIYKCYDTEMKFQKIEEEQKGKWIDIKNNSKGDTLDAYIKAQKRIGKDCIFCNFDVEEHNAPYFCANTINNVDSVKHKTIFGSYSLFSLEESMTTFNICFDSFHKAFPKTFETLSYDLSGQSNKSNTARIELYVDQTFVDAFKKEEKGKTIEQILRATKH